MTLTASEIRSVTDIIPTIRTLEGAGFVVRRPFPTSTLMDFDPFLMLDHLGPVDFGPGGFAGAPDHPHRGFETVSYILEGKLQHKDSVGNSGKLSSGDVQWMTAGSGVVHSETAEDELYRTGGRIQGFQLWVNLPRKDKMIQPRYQDIPSSRIPVATTEDGKVTVKVIAGESLGTSAVIETRTPIMYLHFTLQPGGQIEQRVPDDFNAFAYVFDGEAWLGKNTPRPVREGEMAIFAQDGDTVQFRNNPEAEKPAQLLLIAGVPLNEPIARYGPFVMNTEEEIYQAIRDYQNGKMGSINF